MNILFTDTSWEQYTEWQGQDKKTTKRGAWLWERQTYRHRFLKEFGWQS